MMRRILFNDYASVNPILLFLMTLVVTGLLYSLLFTQVFFPFFDSMIPASDSKVYLYMLFYAMPLFIVVVGMISVFQAALKKSRYEEY